MWLVYYYNTRNIVEFSDGSRASYSAKRYGELLNEVTLQSEKMDCKIWNPYYIREDDIIILYWSQKENKIKEIIIDKEDYDRIKNYYWQLNHNGYPVSRSRNKKTYLYRLLLNFQEHNKIIDHIDRNPLNNKKINLRIVTASENCKNSTYGNGALGVQGVYYNSQTEKFRARAIDLNGKCIDKFFNTLEEAIEERIKMENKFGYLRKLND